MHSVLRVAIALEQNWNTVPGGTAISTNRLASSLVAANEVTPLGFFGKHRSPPTVPLPDIDVIQLPWPGRLMQQAWSRGQLPSIDNSVAADVVHAPAYVLPGTRRPLVVTLHDLAFLHHPEWFTPNGVRFLKRSLEATRERAHAVIVPSPHTAHDCIEAGIDESFVHVVPWGVDLTRPSETVIAEVQGRLGIRRGGVVFVGTREPRKNLESLVRAMKKLPHVPFTVIGPRGWGQVDTGHAHLTGRLSDSEVAALVAGADVLVYPSYFEGFGLPVLEAMAVGTPAIVTAGTSTEWLSGEAGVAVDTTQTDEIVDALLSLLGNYEQLTHLGMVGRQRAATFSWPAAAGRTASVYRQVAS